RLGRLLRRGGLGRGPGRGRLLRGGLRHLPGGGLGRLHGLLHGLLHCHVRRSFLEKWAPDALQAAGRRPGSGSGATTDTCRVAATTDVSGHREHPAGVLVAGATLPSLGRESTVLYPARTAAATAARRRAPPCRRPRDRPSPHRAAARLQALDQPPARPPLPLRSQLLGVRHGGHRHPRRAARQLARGPARGPLPSPPPRRPRPGAAPRPRTLPAMTDTLILNARLVNEGREFDGDLRIRDGRIDAIGSLSPRPGETVVDAAGRRLLPGMIDDQVHFREPGLEHKADIASESAAAVAGGLTSFMDMPNTSPPTLTRAALEDKYARAAGRARANYGFYFGASNDNLEDVRGIDPAATPGLKVFMGASTGNMLVDDPGTLDAIFRDAPVPIITHCEDTPTIDALLAQYRAKYGNDIPAECH